MKTYITPVLNRLWWLGMALMALVSCRQNLPPNFVKLKDIDPSIIQSPRYASADNFLGRPVPGYALSAGLYCTQQTALALKEVNHDLHQQGYALVVYDAYRPQRAVDAFIAWSQSSDDQLGKAKYYPTLAKHTLFSLGYIRKQSGHTRGSTVDLTLIPLKHTLKPITFHIRQLTNGESIPFLDDNTADMGSSFDLFHPVSHPSTTLITSKQAHLRELLKTTMNAHGFQGVDEEWWHFTLINEPYPNTYFDFVPN